MDCDDQQTGSPLALPEPVGQPGRIFASAVFSVWQESLRFADGQERVFDMVRHPGAVAVLPVTTAGEVVLLKQYRHPVGQVLWEVPAGTREPGEEALVCARRELREETGLASPSLQHLFGFYTSPGFCDERMDLFYAPAAAPHPDGAELEPTEQLQVRRLPYERARQMAREGVIQDAKTLLGIWALAQLGLGG